MSNVNTNTTTEASTSSNPTSRFTRLEQFFAKVPCIQAERIIASGDDGAHSWWFKFSIDIHNPIAWQAVQELGHVLNYLSTHERLPTQFFPVSPPPYMNGLAKDFLAWVIQCNHPDFSPDVICDWLEARLPTPVDDLSQWQIQTDMSDFSELDKLNFQDLDQLIPSAH